MPGEASRQPSSIAQGCAHPVKIDTIAAVAADADVGSAAAPRVMIICGKKTRAHRIWILPRDTPTTIDSSNTVTFTVYNISAAGVVGGAIFTKTLTAVPSTVGALVKPTDLGDPVATYWDVEAGGGLGIFVSQVGATADYFHTGVADVFASLAPGEDASIVGN